MIWTHNLQSIEYKPEYVPDKCSSGTPPLPAFVLGSGVNAQDVYAAAGALNHTITLRTYATVGVAGGYAMAGGHGPLARLHGLAVDNLLQFQLVTYTGEVIVANECVSPQLHSRSTKTLIVS